MSNTFEYSTDFWLMPCGCGGHGDYFQTGDDMGLVECNLCGTSTPSMFPESAAETWNDAMGGEKIKIKIEHLAQRGTTFDTIRKELSYRDDAAEGCRWGDLLDEIDTDDLELIASAWSYYFPSKKEGQQ